VCVYGGGLCLWVVEFSVGGLGCGFQCVGFSVWGLVCTV